MKNLATLNAATSESSIFFYSVNVIDLFVDWQDIEQSSVRGMEHKLIFDHTIGEELAYNLNYAIEKIENLINCSEWDGIKKYASI